MTKIIDMHVVTVLDLSASLILSYCLLLNIASIKFLTFGFTILHHLHIKKSLTSIRELNSDQDEISNTVKLQ